MLYSPTDAAETYPLYSKGSITMEYDLSKLIKKL